ncbi:hypothetical protein [Moorena sp. SIOASIH]|uniref:hypothetical protein n=1 Tax=Moorena sp. SIOASIH TaxID=2607817 RepID=UPI0025DA995A|nr:hypothetical protein [Moorena sp. SIOASIH]
MRAKFLTHTPGHLSSIIYTKFYGITLDTALLHKEYELAGIMLTEKNLARPNHDRSKDQDPI